MMQNFLRASLMLPLLLLAALALVPAIASAVGEPFYISFFARIVIYAIAATALNLALGYGGMVGFGHALFMGLGAYCVALPSFLGMTNGWLQLLLTVLVCAVAGLVTGAISLRTRGIAFIMITLAFSQMGYFIFVSLKQFGGDDGMSIAATSRFGGGIDLGSSAPLYYAAWCTLAALVLWMAKVRSAPFGMALRASRQNFTRVNALGFPAMRYQLLAYVISSVACGLSGFLLANLNAFASPGMMSWQISGELIVMVVLGGLGSVFGPLLGAMVFIGLEETLKIYTSHPMIVFGPVIVLVALSGKDGLIGALHWFDKEVSQRHKNPVKKAPEILPVVMDGAIK
jgi:branched-chain amino acid transport system permease protein